MPTTMRRTKKEKARGDGRIRWRKTGGGSFRMKNGKIIKPNQVFLAHPDDIPEAFRDVIVSVDGDLVEKPEEAPLKSATGFEVRKRSNSSWYDVVEPVSGKPINEKALRQAEAEALLAELG